VDKNQFWKYLAYGYFFVNTLAIIALMEFIIFKRPYITLFILILGIALEINAKLFKIDLWSLFGQGKKKTISLDSKK
jgi:hypothetical protein